MEVETDDCDTDTAQEALPSTVFISPQSVTPVQRTTLSKEMSDSLRARLKRSSRYFISPATPKRPCVSHSSSTASATTPNATNSVDKYQSALFSQLLEQGHVLASECSVMKLSSCQVIKGTDGINSNDSNPVIVTPEKSEKLQELRSFEDLKLTKLKLVQSIAQKEEVLRKLNLVKIQHEKNDTSTLKMLTAKWRTVIQQVITDLWTSTTSDPKPTLTELIDYYHIEHNMIGYRADDESFG